MFLVSTNLTLQQNILVQNLIEFHKFQHGELNRAKWESEELKIKSEIFAVICHQSALFDVFKIFDVENWRSLHLNTPAGGDGSAH